MLSNEEGGRDPPLFNGYRSRFHFPTTNVRGTIELPERVEMAMPDDDVQMTAKLIAPLAPEALEVCDARGRAHGGGRRRLQDRRVMRPGNRRMRSGRRPVPRV